MKQHNFQVALLLLSSLPLGSSHAPSDQTHASKGVSEVRQFDDIRTKQWHLDYLKVAKAHRISRGAGITVAVPDTGVSPHPDLEGNLMSGTDMVPGGDGVGHADRNGHGTGMAGLIAAHGRGDTGALGIAPMAKILPIADSPQTGDGDPETLAQAIEYSIERGADVISISSGGGSNEHLRDAVRGALASDVVVVAGAGNLPSDQIIGYPAKEPGVVAVGGVDRAGAHAVVSVTGPEIDLVAPAVDIYSTSIDGKYRKGTGTSDATAIVAGAAALVRSKYPYLPAREVVHRLTATAVDKGPPGRDDEYGYGVIDIVAALTADVPPLGFESATATAPAGGSAGTTAAAPPPGDGDGDRAATVRGMVTLGVIVAGGVIWALVVRRRRRGDDPPPRISH